MKTTSFTPTLHYIDTAPLAARYEVLVASILAYIELGRYRDMLRLSHKVGRLVRVFTKLEARNARLSRKLETVSYTHLTLPTILLV